MSATYGTCPTCGGRLVSGTTRDDEGVRAVLVCSTDPSHGPDRLAGGGGRPQRIQLRRSKGWRKPADVVSVARPSRWGNPFKAGQILDVYEVCGMRSGEIITDFVELLPIDLATAIALYRCHVLSTYGVDEIRGALTGCDLGCWCPTTQPCHADVLLELANR